MNGESIDRKALQRQLRAIIEQIKAVERTGREIAGLAANAHRLQSILTLEAQEQAALRQAALFETLTKVLTGGDVGE